MYLDNSNITIVLSMLAVGVIYILILMYVKPLGLAVDKKIYRLMRIRRFGFDFISHYFKVLCIWFFMVWVLFNQGLIDLKSLIYSYICISIGTVFAATINIKKFHKKDLTILKRRRKQRKTTDALN